MICPKCEEETNIMSSNDSVHRCMWCGENYWHINGVVKTVKELSDEMIHADYEERVRLSGVIDKVLDKEKYVEASGGDGQ